MLYFLGRLPRKTIAKDALAGLNNDDDIDEEDILEKPVVRSSENSPASLKRNNINIKSGQPDLHGVITLPEPGESSTDHNDEIDGANPDDPDYPGDKDAESDNESAQSDSNVTATIEEAGQKLGIFLLYDVEHFFQIYDFMKKYEQTKLFKYSRMHDSDTMEDIAHHR